MTHNIPSVGSFQPSPAFIQRVCPPHMAATAEELFSFTGAPEPMVVGQVLGWFSSLVMLRYRVQIAPGIQCQTGLSTIVIAEKNQGKSTIDNALQSSIVEWKSSQANERLIANFEYQMAHEIHAAKIRHLRRKLDECHARDIDSDGVASDLAIEKLRKPKEPNVWVSQLTTGTFVGVSQVMMNQGSVFWNSPDGGAALKAMTANCASQMADYWSGNSTTHVTRTYGIERAERVRFATCIAVQPDVFAKFNRSRMGEAWHDCGLMGRFLIFAPTPNIGTRSIGNSKPKGASMADWDARVVELLEEIFGHVDEPEVVLTLSEDALEQLQKFRSYCEINAHPGNPFASVQSAAGKAAENACRIASAFHVFEKCSGTEIDGTNMRYALDLMGYVLQEHARLFGEELVNDRIAQGADSLLRYLRKMERMGVQLVPLASVSKHGSKDLREPTMRIAILNYAFQAGFVAQGMPTSISKHNLVLTESGRWRADMVKFWHQPVSA